MTGPPPIKQSLRTGTTIEHGRYKLVRQLGAGGNGVVWLAVHSAMASEVVIKFPLSPIFAEEGGKRRFEQELRWLITFSSQHANIVNILDVGQYQGRPFVVMQYLKRGSLLEYCGHGQGIDSSVATPLYSSADWFVAIADALNYIHSHGLVHRDVKPANILLDDSFSAYLADFGIATVHGVSSEIERLRMLMKSDTTIVGSLPYIAPEILLGAAPSPASDQFSLAVVAYEFFTGHRPFEAKSAAEMVEVHRRASTLLDAQTHDRFSTEIWKCLRRALNPSASLRFDNCLVLAREIAPFWSRATPTARRSGSASKPPLPFETAKGGGITTRPGIGTTPLSDSSAPYPPAALPADPIDKTSSNTSKQKKIRIDRILPDCEEGR